MSAEREVRRFLEEVPPYELHTLFTVRRLEPSGQGVIPASALHLVCDSQRCDGHRWFQLHGTELIIVDRYWSTQNAVFICRNCGAGDKVFSLRARMCGKDEDKAEVMKLGEWPPFGEPVPRKVLDLLGSDKGLFLKGRSAENRGLGIGAFAYYRRVVESRRVALFDAIIKSAELVGASDERIRDLHAAKKTWRFTESIDRIRDLIPEQLKIGQHNPLVLLHKALSEGVHEDSDEECLERATAARKVLVTLLERMEHLKADESDTRSALTALLRQSQAEKPPEQP